MTDQQFDDILKQKLNSIEEPYDSSSWALLSSKLEAPFAEETPEAVADVDRAVMHTLQRMDVPFNPAHWEKMDARLSRDRRRWRIGWYKLSEAAAVLLLVAGLGSLWSVADRHRSPIRRLHPDLPVASAELPSTDASETALTPTVSRKFVRIETAEGAATTETAALLPVAMNGNGLQSVFVSSELPSNAAIQESEIADFGPLPGSGLGVLVFSERASAKPFAPIKTPKTSHFYVVSYGAAEQNSVQIAGETRSSWGHGGGFNLGYRRGKWGVETGLGFSRKQYEPKREVEIYGGNLATGYFGSALIGVEADLISIPLRATRQIAHFGKNNVQALAGVNTCVAVSKTYRYKRVYYPGSAPAGQVNPDQQPTLQQNAKGVFEGGSFSGNTYAVAEAGLRLERPLGKLTAFVEPVYRRSIGNKGIGPKPVGIQTLAISAGVIASL